mmetsp:Transcript_33195/g.56408  ORF Transcript_33195/g.56408 Transcript_33195/m.56408 type:complete len:281 (+) Transcript_33195:808-1650(+)
MWMFDCGALAFGQVGRWVGQVDVDPFNRCAECHNVLAKARFFHAGQHVGGKLQVPGIVIFARLVHGAACGCGITAPFKGHGRKGRFAGVTVVFVGRKGDHVIGTEFRDSEGTRANGVKVGFGALRRLGAEAVGELGLLDDRRLGTHKRTVGEGLGHAKGHNNRLRIGRVDRYNVIVFFGLGTAAAFSGAVFPRELDVLGCHGRAIGPQKPVRKDPCDLCQVFAHDAIFDGGHFVDQPGHQRTFGVIARQRLDHEAGGFQFLGATGQIRVQDRRGLPVDDF